MPPRTLLWALAGVSLVLGEVGQQCLVAAPTYALVAPACFKEVLLQWKRGNVSGAFTFPSPVTIDWPRR